MTAPVPEGAERKVLVGRIFNSMRTTWSEWVEPFDEVVQAMADRAVDSKASGHPDEIIEVIVVRRARVRAEVTVEIADAAEAVA